MTGVNSNQKACTRHRFTVKDVAQLRQGLLCWYDANKRDLPWRRLITEPDINVRGYAIWVSEIMLQQTQVKTVISYYNRWMRKWPTVHSLSTASLEEVNSLWSGLGYYSRAKLLHEAVKKVVNEFGGNLPQTAEQLKCHLPGVGRYTACAISSIAFSERVPVLDGNVMRVLTRLREIGSPIQLNTTNAVLWDLAEQLVDPNRPGDFNQAIMELGAVCCKPKQPNCSECPLGKIGLCGAYESVRRRDSFKAKPFSQPTPDQRIPHPDVEDCGMCMPTDAYDSSLGVMNYPVKLSKRAARVERTIVIIAHTHDNGKTHFLLFQRPRTGLLAGLWEFPSQIASASQLNSKQTETSDDAVDDGVILGSLVDRIATSFNLFLEDKTQLKPKLIGEVVHLFSHIRMTYVVHTLSLHALADRSPRVGRWIELSDLQNASISTATRKGPNNRRTSANRFIPVIFCSQRFHKFCLRLLKLVQ
ncbi:hypothetical protein CRM22_004003 [Opisthorchis felineus]|uniref:Adenine DNA glycosylase n=1 Tax=Opisthorchis felineus TaxID=147828 RepID=A0A4S2LYD6_OPIFE|nr:hypothetical protein CRM22_004003 [Opisthorchis felineus]